MSELLPCPFCGSSNVDISKNTSSGEWHVSTCCGTSDGVYHHAFVMAGSRGEAIKAWNTRSEHAHANDGNAELDSREKLEADVEAHYTYTVSTAMWPPSANKTTHYVSVPMDTVIGWLDRQAAITGRECRKPNWDYCETCEELDRLTAERDALAHDLAESEKLLEQLRDKLGIACDYAHDLLRVMDIDGGA